MEGAVKLFLRRIFGLPLLSLLSVLPCMGSATTFNFDAGQFPLAVPNTQVDYDLYELTGQVGFTNGIAASENQYLTSLYGSYSQYLYPALTPFNNVSLYSSISWVFDFSVPATGQYYFSEVSVVGDGTSSASLTGGGLDVQFFQKSTTPATDMDWSTVYFKPVETTLTTGTTYQLSLNGYDPEYVPSSLLPYYANGGGNWANADIFTYDPYPSSGSAPEPPTWVTITLGLATAGGLLRRQRNVALVNLGVVP